MTRHSLSKRLLSGATALCLLLSGTTWPVAPARAHDAVLPGGQSPVPPPPGDPPRETPDDTDDCACGTDPVLMDTGEYTIERDDLTSPEPVLRGRGGLEIDLRRSYRSGWNYHGVLGNRWDFKMNIRLRVLSNSDILLTTGTCRRDTFTWNKVTKRWDSPPGVFSTLVQNSDATMTQTFPDGMTHHFDVHGSLTKIRDRHGNEIRLHYSATRKLVSARSPLFVDIENRVVTREHRLERITDPTGRQVTLSYHATTGHLTAIADWTGRKWTYAHDVWGNLVTVTAPATTAHPKGAKTTYVYGDTRFPSRITALIPPNGQPATEGATAVARLTNVYDAEGRVIEQRFAGGSVVKVAYDDTTTTVTDASGTQALYTTADGQITGFTVVTRGVRAAEKEASGTRYTTAHTYTTQKQRTKTVFPGGGATERIYDTANADVLARRNLLTLRQVPPTGSTDPVLETTYTYKTPYHQLGTITDPRGNKTEYFYDAKHNLTRIELPAPARTGGGSSPPPSGGGASGAQNGGTTPAPATPPRPTVRFQFDRHGQLTQLTDPEGRVTRWQFDANGYLTQVTRAHGTPLATTTTFTRDSLGRATAIRDAERRTTTYQYSAWDLVTQITAPSPLSYTTRNFYDASRNVTRVERQSSNAEDPQTTTMTYDVRNRITSVTNELGQTTRYAYDPNSNLHTATDPAGRTTTWNYDERNRLYETRDALGHTTRLFYNSRGLLSEVVDPRSQSTRYAYDPFGRLVTTTYADATTELRGHDATGNLTRWTNRAGQVVRFAYDPENRRVSKVTPAGTTRYRYDSEGRLDRVEGPGATLTYAYNERDQRVTETTKPAGRTSAWTVSRAYDAAGRLVKLTYPDGSAYHYVYDALDRLSAVQNSAKVNLVSYRYSPLSETIQSDRQSGPRSTYGFDEASRLTAIAHKQSASATTSLLSLAYTRNAVGQITALTDDLGKTGFSRDAIYRLTGAQAPSTAPYPDLTIAYDKASNRKSVIATSQAAPAPAPQPAPPAPSPAPPTPPAGGAGGSGPDSAASGQQSGGTPPPAPPAPTTPTPTTTAYTANNLNQYTRVGTATYAYSKNGNLTSDGTRTYRWDAENRLTGVTIPGATEGATATTVAYAYDDQHRRVKKTVGTTTTYYLWSGDRLLAEYGGDGTLQRRYLYADGYTPVQVHHITGATTTVYDVHTDHLDTRRLLTNSTGAVVWRSRHQAFGKAHITTDPDGDGTALAFPFRFPGQYQDAETGLHYNRFRYYHPGLGRYLSPDPLGQVADAPNLYDYAGQNPLHQVDPLGLYQYEVHFELTRELGLLIGVPRLINYDIAKANQDMDEDWYYHPFNVVTGTWRHFRDREAVVIDLRSAVVACDKFALGQHLHSYQDTFSHAGFSWPWTLGHVPYSAAVAALNILPNLDIADPDDYDKDSQREVDMTVGTALWLLLYKAQCFCEKNIE